MRKLLLLILVLFSTFSFAQNQLDKACDSPEKKEAIADLSDISKCPTEYSEENKKGVRQIYIKVSSKQKNRFLKKRKSISILKKKKKSNRTEM